MGEKSKKTLTLFFLDQPDGLFGVELAHVHVQRAGVKAVGGHEQAAHVKQRQKIEVDVFWGKAEAVVPVNVRAHHVAVAEQGAPGPSGHRRRVDDDEAVVGRDVHRLPGRPGRPAGH